MAEDSPLESGSPSSAPVPAEDNKDSKDKDAEAEAAAAATAFAAAKAERLEQLTARNDALRVEIAAVEAELEGMRRLLKNPDAASTVQKHIKLLHAYNEIKDIGQGLLGIIADNRNVRIADVHREFDVGDKD